MTLPCRNNHIEKLQSYKEVLKNKRRLLCSWLNGKTPKIPQGESAPCHREGPMSLPASHTTALASPCRGSEQQTTAGETLLADPGTRVSRTFHHSWKSTGEALGTVKGGGCWLCATTDIISSKTRRTGNLPWCTCIPTATAALVLGKR